LGLSLFEALFELLAHAGEVITINEQITALARHRDVRVRDIGATVVSVDRAHRAPVRQKLADEPLGLAFESTLGDSGLGIGRQLKLAFELMAL
jgi:hypothetical protein